MPSADEWSIAIAEWAIEDRRPGERIYLSVDRAVLNRLADSKWNLTDGFDDFLAALSKQLGVHSWTGWTETPLKLPTGKPLAGGVPRCTCFLAFLVVCAARRGEKLQDYYGSGTEFFFPWVRKLLGGLPVATRAGLGGLDMSPAPEPDLWRHWARFLENRGFRSVPETTYQGPKAYSGYSLDQAILTFSCRRTLANLAPHECRALRRWTFRREAGRLTDPPVPHATKHLKELLVERWDDEHVREAVLGAIERAPPGPRPGRDHLTPIRRGVGHYAVAVRAPSGWSRRVFCGENPVVGGEVRLPPSLNLPQFVFRVEQAIQPVDWKVPNFLRFLESVDPLIPSHSGDPELGEEHFLLIPVEELRALEAARGRSECDWDRKARWGGWLEFDAFRLYVPRIETESCVLSVKAHGGLIFAGGIRTGEPGRTPRVLAAHCGGVSPAEGAGQVKLEERGVTLEVQEGEVTPLPELEPGEYHLHFGSRRTKFEIVDWRKVVYEEPEEPGWLQ